ncbi:MAG: GTP-binding protein, partial [Gemmatimonadetes bacterium]|nr:GTP-binding protein [Gemmatimonadota bacterium]
MHDSQAVLDTTLAPLVALVGPPNSGKTTLFNQLTGLRQKVANYPGVTVEKHVGKVGLKDGRELDLVDLPGVHGFSARTLDERVTRDVLEGKLEGMRAPDALVLIVDSTRLENQLMLVEPVLELELPTLLVLNMSDELDERGGAVDDEALARRLGVDIVRTSARTGVGVSAVLDYLTAVQAGDPAAPYKERTLTNVPRSVSLPVVDAFAHRRKLVRDIVDEAGFVPPGPSKLSERLDSVFLHRLFGPLI